MAGYGVGFTLVVTTVVFIFSIVCTVQADNTAVTVICSIMAALSGLELSIMLFWAPEAAQMLPQVISDYKNYEAAMRTGQTLGDMQKLISIVSDAMADVKTLADTATATITAVNDKNNAINTIKQQPPPPYLIDAVGITMPNDTDDVKDTALLVVA